MGALIPDTTNPIGVHWSGAGAAFSTYDYPRNASQIHLTQVLKERLDGQECNRWFGSPQKVDPGQAVCAIFHAHAPPNVRCVRNFAKFASKKRCQTVRALGENLIRVPIGSKHHSTDF